MRTVKVVLVNARKEVFEFHCTGMSLPDATKTARQIARRDFPDCKISEFTPISS